MGQRGNVQIEMNPKVAAIRQDLNAFLDGYIYKCDRSVRDAANAAADFEEMINRKVARVRAMRRIINPFFYVVYLLLGVFGISYGGVDPGFPASLTYKEFCDKAVGNKEQEIYEFRKFIYQAAQPSNQMVKSYLVAMKEIRKRINSSPAETMRGYQHFITIDNTAKEKRYEEIVMVLRLITAYGIETHVTEERIYREELWSKEDRVNDLVRQLKSKYHSDPEVHEMLRVLDECDT